MVVHQIHLVNIAVLPNETDSVSIIDPNAVLPGTVVPQRLQRVAPRTKIVKAPGGVKLKQLPDATFSTDWNFLDRFPGKTWHRANIFQ